MVVVFLVLFRCLVFILGIVLIFFNDLNVFFIGKIGVVIVLYDWWSYKLIKCGKGMILIGR